MDAVTYGEGVFVAVGGGAGKLVETSTDGICWKKQDLHFGGPSGDLLVADIAYGEGHFVARDISKELYVSADGASWNRVAPAPLATYGGKAGTVEWDGSEFIAPVIYEFTPEAVFTSPDGSTWSSVDTEAQPGPLGTSSYIKVAGVWYAVDQNLAMATSTDLLNWTEESIPAARGRAIDRLVRVDGRFMALGDSGMILRSDDGLHWTDVSDAVIGPQALTDLAWNGSTYVAIGSGKLIESQDGTHWMSIDVSTVAPEGFFYSIAAAPNGAFVIVGTDVTVGTGGPSPQHAMDITSLDGVHWSAGNP